MPNPEVQVQLAVNYSYDSSASYYAQLLPPSFQPSGAVLYYVYAVDLPGQQSFHLGHLRALSSFYRSDFGDRALFFKHTIEEEDVQLRPELGLLCPLQSPSCSPCPQTYDCLCDHWRQQIADSPYASYYDPAARAEYAQVSPYVQAAFGTPQHPGPGYEKSQ